MLLYYITDRAGFAGTEAQRREALLRRVAEAARAGVDYIQLREKDLPARELELLARTAVQAVRASSATVKLLVNGRTDVALAAGADGVHLPAGELAASEVRALWSQSCGREPVIGVSAHTVEDVVRAKSEGAKFVVLAPIFEKVQTGSSGIGLEVLRAACARVQSAEFPVFALGGVNLSNALACLDAGATGIAGIRLFQQGDIFETVKRLRAL